MSVINLKGRKPQTVNEEKNELYIGRSIFMGGWKLPKSKWFNPFKAGKDGTLDQVLVLYEKYVHDTGLIKDIQELNGKILCCWCYPNPCHGNVLLRLLNGEHVNIHNWEENKKKKIRRV